MLSCEKEDCVEALHAESVEVTEECFSISLESLLMLPKTKESLVLELEKEGWQLQMNKDCNEVFVVQ